MLKSLPELDSEIGRGFNEFRFNESLVARPGIMNGPVFWNYPTQARKKA